MANKIMKTLTMNNTTYELVDEAARTDIAVLKQNGGGNGNGLSIDLTDTEQGTATGIDADTLGGVVASEYVLQEELETAIGEIIESSVYENYVLKTKFNEYKNEVASTIETSIDNLENNVSNNYLLKTETAVAANHSVEADHAANADNATNAENSAMLGGKAPIYYIQPRNLLDNSDFRNPVNQRGVTSSTGGYGIDRWLGSYTIKSGCVQLTGGFTQYISEDNVIDGRMYTSAVLLENGTIYIGSSTLTKSTTDWLINKWHGDLFMGVMYESNRGAYKYYLNTANGATFNVVWAALYEGEYTADNLPPYVPKGYGTELTECQRYYIQIRGGTHFIFRTKNNYNTAANAFEICPPIIFPTPMRSVPAVTLHYDITDSGGVQGSPFSCSNCSCTMPGVSIPASGFFDLNKFEASADL